MVNNTLVNDVRAKANGHWEGIFQRMGIPTNRQEGECPNCGGKTRYRFDDKDGRGTYFCSHCGAGTGLDLVMKVNQCEAVKAAELVAEAMSLPLPEPARKEAPKSEAQSVADKVNKLLAQSIVGVSGYLRNKGHEIPLPLLSDGSLLVVLKNGDKEITGAQVIKPDGTKRLLSGSVKKGSYYAINTPEVVQVIVIAEGVATALSTHLISPDALTVAAIDAGNIAQVAQVMRGKHPEAKIIIAGDNDITYGHQNTGKISAEKAAKMVDGWVTVPPTAGKADWNDHHQQNGIESATAAFNNSMYRPQGEKMKPALTVIDGGKDNKVTTPALNQMGASQRGEVLLTRFDGDLAIHGDSDTVHHYNGTLWVPVSDKDLQREMAAIFIESDIPYSQNGIKSAVDTMKLSLIRMGNTARNLIGFSNGVFDTRAGEFREHHRDDWLLIASDVAFSQAQEGETLSSHAPNFWKWLTRSTGGNTRKADRVLSALYMVMANRYDWQLFLEITGPGGSGKSVLAEICTMLAGKANTVSASMAALENPRERALVVGYSLIIMPDMSRYAGDGAGIKAITGGDKVAIDPKHKAPYSTRIPAVILAVNNNAMSFSDRSGGISRRRVIFNFSEVVPENDRDPLLPEKIEEELAVIIRHLLTRFADQEEAKRLLFEQQKSEEALAIKREGDSLVDFCGYLMASMQCDGMFIGNASIIPFNPRKYLYHAYLAYMQSNGLSKPVSLNRFASDMPGSMAEYGKEYIRRKSTKGNMRSNISLGDDAEEWLPSATGGAV